MIKRFIMCALVGALLGPLTGPSDAIARTGAQAENDARYYSAVDCPHHTLGICLRRDSGVLGGIGGGRWVIMTVGWESGVYDLSRDWQHARWYYRRICTLQNDGTRTGCYWA